MTDGKLIQAEFALQEAIRWIEKAADLVDEAGHGEHADMAQSLANVDIDRKLVRRLIEAASTSSGA